MSMFKKKEKVGKATVIPPKLRIDTEADILSQKEPFTRVSMGSRCEYEEMGSGRIGLKCKDLERVFEKIKNILEEELDDLIIGEPIGKLYEQLEQSHLFKVRETSKEEILEELGKILQACELLYSKLRNNEKIKDTLYIKEEEDLLLFFKHLFGKPYTVCNLPNFRKVLNTIWQHQIFQTFDPIKMADHLRQWCSGIEFPLNPAAIPLHRLVFTNPSLIKKHAMLLSNSVAYCNINSGDCMGLTPLLVAAHANKANAFEFILKSGANVFKCPLTILTTNSSVTNIKKGGKENVEIIKPITERRQFNIFEILNAHKQFQQIVNVLSMNEVYKLKRMKKGVQKIYEELCSMPDCCLQIHWKTNKGFLSFKQLPKDVITVYKKKGSLRIDYHIDDLQQVNAEQGHFSILILTGNEQDGHKLQYYLIDHNSKKISNLMREIHSPKLKLRYEQITQLGNIEEMYVSHIKSSTKVYETNENMEISLDYTYENILKAPIYEFKDLSSYERTLFDSDVIDYAILEKSETTCSTKQVIGNLPKVKAKSIKSSSSFKIEWVKEKINLKHISFILSLVDKKSPLFLKVQLLLNALMKEEVYSGKYCNKLPIRTMIDLGADFNLQVEIKNLTYMNLNDAVFGLEYRTKTMNYEEQNVSLDSLQETMLMEESYSISMSRFLGKTERQTEFEDEEANQRFDEILSREIACNGLSDEEDNSQENEKYGSMNKLDKIVVLK